jgi:hypothetical protein
MRYVTFTLHPKEGNQWSEEGIRNLHRRTPAKTGATDRKKEIDNCIKNCTPIEVEYYVSNEFIEFLTEYKKSGLPQNITAIIKELRDRKWKKEQEEQMTKKENHST